MSNATNVIIIDDEPLARSLVKEFLIDHNHMEVVAECDDGFQGIKAIGEHRPDLVFLDVQMPKITGLEMLELLDEVPSVIFTTAYEEYAIKAFEANAVDYLLKPFSKARFDEAVARYQSRPKLSNTEVQKLMDAQPTNRIVIRDGGRIRILPLKAIIHLEADDDYVKITTQEGTFMKKATLKHYEDQLPDAQFVRIHRSFMVNVGYITRIDPYEKASHMAVLSSGGRLPVSKSGYQRLKEVLGI